MSIAVRFGSEFRIEKTHQFSRFGENSKKYFSDLCVEYAYKYSEDSLSEAFSRSIGRIVSRYPADKFPNAHLPSAYVNHGPYDTEALPRSMEGLLWDMLSNGLRRIRIATVPTSYLSEKFVCIDGVQLECASLTCPQVFLALKDQISSRLCIDKYREGESNEARFPDLSEGDFVEAMRMHVYQNSMNIIALGNYQGKTLRYLKFKKWAFALLGTGVPPLP